MLFRNTAFLILCFLFSGGSQQQVALTPRTIADLMQFLSTNCQGELQGAVQRVSEMSDHCKFEVQVVLKREQLLEKQEDELNQEYSPDGSNLKSSVGEDRRTFTKTTGSGIGHGFSINPMVAIVLFVTFLVAGGTFAIIVINNEIRGKIPKSKRISKKKEEKLRARTQVNVIR
jgi:hypothetical protein